MKSKSNGLYMFALICLSLGLNAQVDPQVFTLKESVKYALEHSLEVQKALLNIDQADHVIGELKSQGLPQINGNGDLQNFPNIPTQLLPGEIVGQPPGTYIPVQFGTEYTANVGIDATQLIYDQTFFAGLKAARTSEELYSLLKLGTDQDVIYAVANAFYSVLEIGAQKEVLEANIVQIEKLEELMKTRYENDLVTKIDYNRLKVNRTNLETNRESLLTQETNQKNYLKLLMGMPMNAEIELEAQENMADITLVSLENEKLEPTQVKIINKQIELSILNKKSVGAGYAPTLSAFGQQSWQAQRNEFNFLESGQPWFQQTVIGVRLKVPIFDGLRKHHQMAQTKIDIDKAEIDRMNVERNNTMEYENAKEKLYNTLKSVEAQKENKDLAQEVYDQTKELYGQSVSTLTDFLNAENALREAQINYYRQLLKFKQAELDLLKAQGQLIAIAKS